MALTDENSMIMPVTPMYGGNGGFGGGFGGAFIQAEEIKKASESELLEIAADNGIDVKSYVF